LRPGEALGAVMRLTSGFPAVEKPSMVGSTTRGRGVSSRRRLAALAALLLAGSGMGADPRPNAAGQVSSGPPADSRGATSGFNAPNGCRNLTLLGYPAAGLPRVLPLTHFCPFEPRTDCRGEALPNRSRLALREKRGDSRRDVIKWKLKKGEAIAPADLGDPTVDTDYELCVYVEANDVCWLVLHPDALAGPGWKARRKGFLFKAKKGAHEDGLRKLRLRSGPDRKARLQLKGKGPRLELRALPVPSGANVLVQLYNGENQCWSTEFGDAPLADDAKRFKDRSD
jgi:hypothetical protein